MAPLAHNVANVGVGGSVTRQRATAALALAVASVLPLGGCRVRQAIVDGAAGSPVVAVVANVTIGTDDVRRQMKARGGDARRAVDDLVAFELLARAASDAGHGVDDASDARALRQARVNRLIEREVEPRLAASEIPDADVRALYERGKEHFVHGRLVQVAVLCVFTGARMHPEPRARAADNAQKLWAFIEGGAPRTASAFEAIARDPRWVERRVSFTTVWQSEDAPFPATLGRAVQALDKPGATTALVGDETGYYIATYVSERAAENITFAEAAPALKREMYEPWRRRRFLELTNAFAQSHAIEVFPENLPLLAAPPPAR